MDAKLANPLDDPVLKRHQAVVDLDLKNVVSTVNHLNSQLLPISRQTVQSTNAQLQQIQAEMIALSQSNKDKSVIETEARKLLQRQDELLDTLGPVQACANLATTAQNYVNSRIDSSNFWSGRAHRLSYIAVPLAQTS